MDILSRIVESFERDNPLHEAIAIAIPTGVGVGVGVGVGDTRSKRTDPPRVFVKLDYDRVFDVLGGTFSPPQVRVKEIKTKKDRNNLGFLNGVASDLKLVTAYVNSLDQHTMEKPCVIHTYYFDSMHGTAVRALHSIKNGLLFALAKKAKKYTLCYSGHGEVGIEHTSGGYRHGAGDWIFTDANISLFQILQLYTTVIPTTSGDIYSKRTVALEIFSDCCYSGNWVKLARDIYDAKSDMHKGRTVDCIPTHVPFDERIELRYAIMNSVTIYASSNINEIAPDTDDGGYLFQLISNRKSEFVSEKIESNGWAWIHCKMVRLNDETYIERTKQKLALKSDESTFVFDTFDLTHVEALKQQRMLLFPWRRHCNECI